MAVPGGWTLTVDRGGNGADAMLSMQADGLHMTSLVDFFSSGERRPCTLLGPLLLIPSPLEPGKRWTAHLSCPTGDLAGDNSSISISSRVVGQQTIAIGGRSIEVVRIEADSSSSSRLGATHGHHVNYVYPGIGLFVEQVTDGSGVVSSHILEMLTTLPSS